MGISAFGCVNNTIRLRSGRYFDLAAPKPKDFTFLDIAGALSKICRFGGQCDGFYSVAEHSVHCCQRARIDGLPLDTQRALLLHDAAEAFVGDMVKPLKIMLPAYSEIEAAVEVAIAEKFLIDFEREQFYVKKIDHEMLICERRALFSGDSVVWTGENEVRRINHAINAWQPRDAEREFFYMAAQIGIDVNA